MRVTRSRLLNETQRSPRRGDQVYCIKDGRFTIGVVNTIQGGGLNIYIQGIGYIDTVFDWRSVDDVIGLPTHRFNIEDDLIHLRMRDGYLGFSDKDGFELIHRRMEGYIDKSPAAMASLYKIDIHHRNKVKIDNRTVNLVGLTANEHRILHEHEDKQIDLFL